MVEEPSGEDERATTVEWAFMKFENGHQARRLAVEATATASQVKILGSHTIAELLQAASPSLLPENEREALLGSLASLVCPAELGKAIAEGLNDAPFFTKEEVGYIHKLAGLENQDSTEETEKLKQLAAEIGKIPATVKPAGEATKSSAG